MWLIRGRNSANDEWINSRVVDPRSPDADDVLASFRKHCRYVEVYRMLLVQSYGLEGEVQ